MATDGKCFFPNGLQATGNSPCNVHATNSVCCAGGIGSSCLANGLCRNGDGHQIRGACTNSNWDGCLDICLAASTGGTDVISCQNSTNTDTSFCCDHVSLCCDSGIGRFDLLPRESFISATWNSASTQFVVISAVSSTVATTNSRSTVRTSLASLITTSTLQLSSERSQTPAFTSSDSTTIAAGISTSSATGTASVSRGPFLSVGAKAGIGVGVIAGVFVAALVGYLMWRLRAVNVALIKENVPSKLDQPDLQLQQAEITANKPGLSYNQMHAVPISELDSTTNYRQLELPT
ncbi:hypothetical protein GLAREA_10767 [Glarea lozoyensis ATCC 20868]|uniref:Mid2 domain-containing protein n=1 Tax=Glarea lozoyensis (strain ATCC 20868 / MF5171) TaxID=1116229 RepID=S3DSW6_GLAL2|nr:uncharacterized protein GLAREA_10767 [Glarea lozoyensis ATCC 20868]EPE35071.1 hypothetical protein GLAREA_10767 [Glarea lozoyensis ATCC 20868]